MSFFTEKSAKRLIYLGVSIILISGVFFLLKELTIFNYSIGLNSEWIAQYGDFIGGLVGTLWALVGVILFYIALNEQRKDFRTNKKVLEAQLKALVQQSEEFKLQREELEQTREVFSIQSLTLKKQQFETTFFSMINLHHSIVDSIDLIIRPSKEKITGRDCFKTFYNHLKNTTNASRVMEPINLYTEFSKTLKRFKSDLGHYFQNFYQILVFLERNNEINNEQYVSLLQSQLSTYEFSLMFYYNIYFQFNYTEDYKKIKRLNFFSKIKKEDLLLPGHIRLIQ